MTVSRCLRSSAFIQSVAGPRSVPQRAPIWWKSLAWTADRNCASVSVSDCGAGVWCDPPPHASGPSARSTTSAVPTVCAHAHPASASRRGGGGGGGGAGGVLGAHVGTATGGGPGARLGGGGGGREGKGACPPR